MYRHKYNAKKTNRIIGGKTVTFDSLKEARRFDVLILLHKAGKIKNLVLQPRFKIAGAVKYKDWRKMSIRHYIADFSYTENGIAVVEDTKGFKTPMYNLKKQLFLSLYGNEYDFRET